MPPGAAAVARTAQAAPAAVRNTSLTPIKQAYSSPRQQVSQQNTQQNPQSTPQQPAQRTPLQQRASPAVSTPGQWQHPRMEEVLRRQNATNFDKNNVFRITYCACALLLTVIIPHFANQAIPTALLEPLGPYPHYFLLFLRAILTGSLLYAFSPLLLTPDPCEDIPLTPSQRHMLGLPPSIRPETALDQASYVTPPRYSRSSTPRSNASSLRGSPLSGSPSNQFDFGATQRRNSNSPYSPSPLNTTSFRDSSRSSIGGFGVTRRLSYGGSGKGSPNNNYGLSEFEAAGNMGSPSKGNKASVGLNSKWLYEKGRGSPSGSGFGGSRRPSIFS